MNEEKDEATPLTHEEIIKLMENYVEITAGSTPGTENLRLVDQRIVVDLETGEVRYIGSTYY